ncbi:modification methylase-like protein [Diaporthe eres]|nr:modification methylase-like protein [Diaporthe eres]
MGFLVTSDHYPRLSSGPMDLDEGPMQSHQDDEAAFLEAVAEEDEFDDTDLESDFDNVQQRPQTSSRGLVIEIPRSTLIAPRSSFRGTADYASISRERTAVQSLLDSDPTQLDEDFIEFELDDFVVYIDTQRHPQEMRALHTHATLSGQQKFYFNGTLKLGDVKHRVERVPFDEIPLGNYGKDHSTVGDQLWIRSELNRRRNIYYQLKTPSIEYARFHRDFLWVTDLAKHAVDFSEHLLDLGQSVSIRHFGQDFVQWLQTVHRLSPTFQKWYEKRGTNDFRQSIIANQLFIRKELFDMFGGRKWSRIDVFKEISNPFVTPYIFDCFSHMKMGMILKPVQPSVSTEEAIARSWPADGTKELRFTRPACTSQHRQTMIESIKPGDTISIIPDKKGETDTQWSTNIPDKKWYGLVQNVSMANAKTRLQRQFDITWLYDPEDTPCCSMRYPWKNELFLSDHCTCEERQRKIPEHAVIGVHTVEWFGATQTKADFFVRQTYQVEQRRWVTLQQTHLRCRHEEQQRPEYLVGETVLVSTPVRCYYPGETIPTPYNRNGTGNAFVITHRKSADGSVHPLSSANKPRIRQGFDPKRPIKKLRALDLFSGCGNFGRGLEDGGAVEAKWVNDIWPAAIHTYMANSTDPDSVRPFLGSIDELNLRSFEGKFTKSVPQPGEAKNRSLVAAFAAAVDFHRPKYGILENVKTIVQSKGNRTEDYFSQLICAIVGMGYQAQIILGDAWSHGAPQGRVRAFLYFAAPGLELPQPPVPSHSHPRKKECGSLGMMTNGEPYITRSNNPTPFKYVTALEATADLPDIYDAKTETCVAFPDHRLSVSLSSGDLKIGVKDGRGKKGRTQGLNMPTRPFAMNISRAWHHSIKDNLSGDTVKDMFDHERDAYPRDGSHRTSNLSKGWGRVHPHGLFHTVTTICQWTDARVGRLSHWDQPRPLTVMEARRAQGIPDHEVLLGTPKDQWEMVGNAVARQIAMALGLALRKAWVGTLYDDGEAAPAPPADEEEQAAENGFGPAEVPVANGEVYMVLDSY